MPAASMNAAPRVFLAGSASDSRKLSSAPTMMSEGQSFQQHVIESGLSPCLLSAAMLRAAGSAIARTRATVSGGGEGRLANRAA